MKQRRKTEGSSGIWDLERRGKKKGQDKSRGENRGKGKGGRGGRRGKLRKEEDGEGKGETTILMCSYENCFSNKNSDSYISALESKDLNTFKSDAKWRQYNQL